ncbi:hypothetical protein LZ30DRAFT_738463 [Colletotrichum cereale]|nr:hypothetical protein LZ30DRAFT_738463 [Colletotrichum cereale]
MKNAESRFPSLFYFGCRRHWLDPSISPVLISAETLPLLAEAPVPAPILFNLLLFLHQPDAASWNEAAVLELFVDGNRRSFIDHHPPPRHPSLSPSPPSTVIGRAARETCSTGPAGIRGSSPSWAGLTLTQRAQHVETKSLLSCLQVATVHGVEDAMEDGSEPAPPPPFSSFCV